MAASLILTQKFSKIMSLTVSVTSMSFSFFTIFSYTNSFVSADLPVHCLRHQIVGDWEFHLSPPSPQRSSCGHERPDNPKNQPPIRTLGFVDNAGNVDINNDINSSNGDDSSISDSLYKTKQITLFSPNRAETSTDSNGSFTLIYDEGFEVVVDNMSFFAFSRFDLDKAGTNTTHCEETMTGWYHDQDGENYGCYYGRKVSPESSNNDANENPGLYSFLAPSNSENFDHADIMSDSLSDSSEIQSSEIQDGPELEQPLSEAFHSDVVDKINAKTFTAKSTDKSNKLNNNMYDSVLGNFNLNLLQRDNSNSDQDQNHVHWKAKAYKHFVNKTRSEINQMAGIKRSIGIKEAKNQMNNHRSKPVEYFSSFSLSFSSFLQQSHHAGLPDSIDWDEQGVLDPVVNQGDCGSCFTVATTRMLSARRRILTNNVDASAFSISFPLHCSEYNQGCDGGYAFLQSKWSQDVGLIPAKCFPYSPNGSCRDKILDNSACIQDSGPHYRAKKHRYVGGYYGGSDEEDIMLELSQNGPIVVSFEPGDDFMYYNSGIYSSPQGGNAIHQEWERVDHAVLLVGYGVDHGNTGKKFWKLQNSWGNEWGENGFFRIMRGDNDSGIESIAVAADVEEFDGESLRQFLKSRESGE